MFDSILVRNSNGKREEIASLPGAVSYLSFSRSKDSWFFLKPGVNSIFIVDNSGEIDTWITEPELTDVRGICCGINSIFILNKNGEIYGFNIENRTRYRPLGLRGVRDIMHRNRGGFPEDINLLCYDKTRDSIYIIFPKKGDICSIDGGSTITAEFGSKDKEFSIGSLSLECGLINPVSISVSKKGLIAVADKNLHVIWLFQSSPKNHKLIGVYGTPYAEGSQDGSLLKSSFSFPSSVLTFNEEVYVLDNSGRRIRKIDIKDKTCETICETKVKAICLTTDYKNNICWVEGANAY